MRAGLWELENGLCAQTIKVDLKQAYAIKAVVIEQLRFFVP